MTDQATRTQDEYARIGGVLRAAREALGYTQLRMAAEVGVSEGTYSRYESGKQKITIPELKHAAALLGVPLEAVLAGAPSGPALVPDLADRIAERVTQRVVVDLADAIGVLVRVVLAEERAQTDTPVDAKEADKLLGSTDYRNLKAVPRPIGVLAAVALMAG